MEVFLVGSPLENPQISSKHLVWVKTFVTHRKKKHAPRIDTQNMNVKGLVKTCIETNRYTFHDLALRTGA